MPLAQRFTQEVDGYFALEADSIRTITFDRQDQTVEFGEGGLDDQSALMAFNLILSPNLTDVEVRELATLGVLNEVTRIRDLLNNEDPARILNLYERHRDYFDDARDALILNNDIKDHIRAEITQRTNALTQRIAGQQVAQADAFGAAMVGVVNDALQDPELDLEFAAIQPQQINAEGVRLPGVNIVPMYVLYGRGRRRAAHNQQQNQPQAAHNQQQNQPPGRRWNLHMPNMQNMQNMPNLHRRRWNLHMQNMRNLHMQNMQNMPNLHMPNMQNMPNLHMPNMPNIMPNMRNLHMPNMRNVRLPHPPIGRLTGSSSGYRGQYSMHRQAQPVAVVSSSNNWSARSAPAAASDSSGHSKSWFGRSSESSSAKRSASSEPKYVYVNMSGQPVYNPLVSYSFQNQQTNKPLFNPSIQQQSKYVYGYGNKATYNPLHNMPQNNKPLFNPYNPLNMPQNNFGQNWAPQYNVQFNPYQVQYPAAASTSQIPFGSNLLSNRSPSVNYALNLAPNQNIGLSNTNTARLGMQPVGRTNSF